MADGPALALQREIVARLRGALDVHDLVGGRIYDEPPEKPTRPFVQIGNIEVIPSRTDGHTDWDVTFSVEAHSRPVTAGRVEATAIAAAIVAALDDAELWTEGYHAPWCWFLTQAVVREGDGKSYTATVAFEAALEPDETA